MAHFKLETELQGFMCSFDKGQELEFSYKLQAPVLVSFKPRDRLGEVLCTAVTVRDIKADVCEEIRQSIDAGNIKVFAISSDTRRMIDYIFIDLRAVSRSTIAIFNWTHGLDSPIDPCPSVRSKASYSEDGTRWFQYSEARRIRGDPLSVTHSIYARNVHIDQVVRKVEAGAEVPLGRQLFYEAWSQAATNPRSALVIGVTAAEVGLKKLIAALIPGTDWLMEEMPTPPVGTILRKILPTLQVKAKRVDGRPITPPPKLIRQIEEAVKHRNDVVHAGKAAPSGEELAKILQAISDLLWFFDIYLGEIWAEKHVSFDTKKRWQA